MTTFNRLCYEKDREDELGRESKFYFDHILDDILKYADPKHDKTALSNYFYDVLGSLCSAEKEEAFRRGLIAGCDLFRVPEFNEFTAEYPVIAEGPPCANEN